jgi:hypothetical protein
MSRLEQLLRFAEEEPNDPFNLYAVAMEYLKLDQGKATPFFEVLVKEHPAYVPTYYTFGKLLQAQKEFDRAMKIFTAGVGRARDAGDRKAMEELKSAISDLEFDSED